MAYPKKTNDEIREEVAGLTQRLESGIQDLYASDRYAAYLDTLSKFHNYSLRNTILIHLQMPSATQVAGFNTWKNQFGRSVMKGQKGLRILAPAPFIVKKEMEKIDPDTQTPMPDENGKIITEEVDVTIPHFRAVSVFDVSQTEGPPLPVLAENLTGDVRQYAAFMDALKSVSAMPIAFEALAPETDGECRLDSRTIAIREGMSEVQTVAAVIHEMTHAELHDYNEQLKGQEAENAEAADGADKPRSRRAEEVEAESVAYVVCQHYGIETGKNSFGYIANWSRGKELDELKASLDVIRTTAVSLIDRIDARFTEICKERGIDLAAEKDDAQAAEAIKQEAAHAPQQAEPVASPSPYTALQQKGMDLAQSLEKLPMQDRLNIIAGTFGCKTAHIETSPCGGKWRGTSDISIVFDNGTSLFVGNCRTPKAKTAKEQNACVSAALAKYHPDIVREAKALAAAALTRREAQDNAVAAEKGLKPYTFLNVELGDGTAQGGHLGWYYVTLAVDGIIHAHLTSGLNYDTAAGRMRERISERAYFVAGALKDDAVDYVFNNVGHSTTGGIYTVELTDDARQRAEQTLAERLADKSPGLQAAGPEQTPGEWLPDPSMSAAAMLEYGYKQEDMYPLSGERAAELFDSGHTIYMLYSDNTEAMAFDRDEIITFSGEGLCGITKADWELSPLHEARKEAAADIGPAGEPPPAQDAGNRYEIYQLKGGDKTRYYRFESLASLAARGLSVDRGNYEMVYTAPLAPGVTPEGLYTQFNVNHPVDFRGHSLSMSDVIVLHREGKSTAHYVDRASIAALPVFAEREKQPEAAVSAPPPTGPTVAELDAQVKAGQSISLIDLAGAAQQQRQQPRPQASRPKAPAAPVKKGKPSILASLREAQRELEQARKQQANAPKRDNGREV